MVTVMPSNDLCTSCGACCSHYRVSFYWAEDVPEEFTLPLPPFRSCMKGTSSRPIRCIALTGNVGACVSCSIYDKRPSTCRNFGLNYMDGEPFSEPLQLEGCNAARAAWNLPPLVALANAEGGFRVGLALQFPGLLASLTDASGRDGGSGDLDGPPRRDPLSA